MHNGYSLYAYYLIRREKIFLYLFDARRTLWSPRFIQRRIREKQSMKLYRVNSSPLRAERSHFSRCKRQHSLKQGATRVSINGNTGSHASQSVMRISWELIQRKLFGISISLEIYTNIQIEDLSKPCRRSKTLIQNSNSIISQTKREFKFRYNTISSE